MNGIPLLERVREAHAEGRRLVAPLMGFPGVEITGTNIKLAQQNFGEHFRAVKSLVDRFAPDIIFPLMDLSVEANAVGRYTVFPREDSATVVKGHFRIEEIDRLKAINIAFDSRIQSSVDTVKMMSVGLPSEVLKGAYVVGPYTLAALIWGADEAATASISDRAGLHALCDFTTEKIQEYSRLLIAAGAQIIGILDPSAVMLGPRQFEEFCAGYVRHIIDGFRYANVGAVYHICGNTMHLLRHMAATGAAGLSLDAPEAGVDLRAAAAALPKDILILGNVSPTAVMLHGSPADVARETRSLLEAMRDVPSFVLSTGCDLPQETPLANIEAFMRAGWEPRP